MVVVGRHEYSIETGDTSCVPSSSHLFQTMKLKILTCWNCLPPISQLTILEVEWRQIWGVKMFHTFPLNCNMNWDSKMCSAHAFLLLTQHVPALPPPPPPPPPRLQKLYRSSVNWNSFWERGRKLDLKVERRGGRSLAV